MILQPTKLIRVLSHFAIAGALLALAQQTLAGELKSVPGFYNSGFDGDWIGQVTAVSAQKAPFDTLDNGPITLRLLIRRGQASILARGKGDWSVVMPTKTHLVVQNTNAIVYGNDASLDETDKTGNGGWVETWNMTLTKKDDKLLYVYFVRAVNNYLLPPEYRANETRGRFIFSYTGALHKK